MRLRFQMGLNRQLIETDFMICDGIFDDVVFADTEPYAAPAAINAFLKGGSCVGLFHWLIP